MQRPAFRFRYRAKDEAPLESGKVFLRAPRIDDFAEWSSLRARSRAFLEPWEPRWPDDDLTREAYRYRVRRYDADRSGGLALPLFVFVKDSGRLVGGLTIGGIRRGAAEACTLGYWMGEPFAGKGYMHDALSAIIPHVFDRMRLHRIEAACIPENERSARLLEKVGFRREGHLRGYLKINGTWRDHLLYALISEDWKTARNETKATG